MVIKKAGPFQATLPFKVAGLGSAAGEQRWQLNSLTLAY